MSSGGRSEHSRRQQWRVPTPAWAKQHRKVLDANITVTREYSARGRLRAKLISAPIGASSSTPGWVVARRIRAALNPRLRPDCIVYDAAGKPIATINGETRKRRTLLPPRVTPGAE